ncbi:VWA-like domain-containing protein [Myxococcota bacterium]
MVSSHPLYAVLVDRWGVIEGTAHTPTMGVCITDDFRIELHYNPEFVTGIAPDELVGVILHEVHHVLFGHVTMTPVDFPDQTALLIAQEVTANEFITGSLPGTPMRLDMFGLRPGESTKQRYHRLANTHTNLSHVAVPIDDHGQWPASAPSSGNVPVEAIIAADVKEAMTVLPSLLRQQAANALQRILPPSQGTLPADKVIALAGGAVARTDWTSVLRSLIWRLSQPTPSLLRPSRRFPHLVGIVPGRTKTPKRPDLLAVLDTSGSMNDSRILATIRSEVHVLHSLADILVVECDARVHREYRYTGELVDVVGGGGTSFVEPLTQRFLEQRRADLVLYFTDGAGTAPSRPPPIPVLWCLIGEFARKPASWGQSLHIRVGATRAPAQGQLTTRYGSM